MEALKKWFKDIMTEPNGETHCFVRWTALIGGVQGLSAHAWATFVQHVPFDFQAYGIGLGALLATLGAALAVKKDSP